MKLYTKIAGTLALPLALAVAAGSAQAYTVVDTSEHKLTVGGYVSAIATWDKQGDKKSATNNKFNSNFNSGNSRLNIGYTNKEIGTLFFYEMRVEGAGLRHAFFKTEDGIIGGHTWSFGTNLVALAETIDTTGNSLVSYQVRGPRNLLLGKKFQLDDSMSVGVAIEGKNNQKEKDGLGNTVDGRAQVSKAPSVSVNFEGDFSGIKVFAALTNYAANKRDHDSGYDPTVAGRYDSTAKESGKDKRFNRVTLGTAIPMGDATLKLGLTHNRGITSKNMHDSKAAGYSANQFNYGLDTAKGTHASAALTYRFTEKLRANVAGEFNKWDKHAFAKSFDANSTAFNNRGKSAGTGKRFWVNAFYQADNGIEWGAELQRVSVKAEQFESGKAWSQGRIGYDATGSEMLFDKGTSVRLQAKYAF